MSFRKMAIVLAVAFWAGFLNAATVLDTVGVTLLRTIETNLNGSGVRVAQPEAPELSSPLQWEVAPASVGQPVSLFTYISTGGVSTVFPNTLGIESGHADAVGGLFYGSSSGVAPGVSHVDNYEANYFYNSNIVAGLPIAAKIVPQSFIFEGITVAEQQTIDSQYDSIAAQKNILFVSGAGNTGPPDAPSTCYNGISVGAFGGQSSVGPTRDNGRSKPDITAPAGVTSFSTPLVAGAAALLVQAGTRGDGGTGTTNSATDIRTLKALLLNGAVKPSNWTHTATAPLDTNYGAGILNAFNSYEQLAAGKFSFVESTTVSTGGAHPPGTSAVNVGSLIGWDFNSISSSFTQDRVNHYYFNVPTNVSAFVATLVWNRAAGAVNARNLDLFLYNTANTNLVASSVSTVDNVEHLFIPALPGGRYDLQVWKKGGPGQTGTETYALAFTTFAPKISLAKSGTNVVLSWPLYPNGFRLQSTPGLNSPISWSAVTNAIAMTNNQNQVTLPATASMQFFELVSP